MKNISNIILSVLIVALLISVTTVAKAEWFKVFELAESGITITFPMTADEIAAEDAEKAKLNSAGKKNVTNPEESLHIFELAESGQTISFPMSAEEIAAKDAAMAKSNVSAIRINKPHKRVIQFELAESGLVIEFPATEVEAVSEYNDEIIGSADKAEAGDSMN